MKEFNEYIEREGNQVLKDLVDKMSEVDGIMLEASFYQFAKEFDFAKQEESLKKWLPRKANHKSFGKVTIIGCRTESDSNNNFMWLIKTKSEHKYWVYDYETQIL